MNGSPKHQKIDPTIYRYIETNTFRLERRLTRVLRFLYPCSVYFFPVFCHGFPVAYFVFFGDRESMIGAQDENENDSCASYLFTEPSHTAKVSTGTTIMAVEFSGGVVLGADTRTSAGQYVVNRASRKVSQLHQRIFVARSGSAADTQALTSYVKLYLSEHALELGEYPRVNAAASLMQLLCYTNKEQVLAGVIVAGWDRRLGGQVYQIPLGGTRLRTPYAIGGSGSAYIAAYAESAFRPNMTKDECLEFVKKCIGYAISLDGSSGGLIRLTAVTEDQVEEQVVTGDQLPVPL